MVWIYYVYGAIIVISEPEYVFCFSGIQAIKKKDWWYFQTASYNSLWKKREGNTYCEDFCVFLFIHLTFFFPLIELVTMMYLRQYVGFWCCDSSQTFPLTMPILLQWKLKHSCFCRHFRSRITYPGFLVLYGMKMR